MTEPEIVMSVRKVFVKLIPLSFAEVVTKGAEVKSGTTNVPITCTISDVTSAPTVTWSDGVNSISNGADYAVGTVTLTGTIAQAVLTVQKESTATTHTHV